MFCFCWCEKRDLNPQRLAASRSLLRSRTGCFSFAFVLFTGWCLFYAFIHLVLETVSARPYLSPTKKGCQASFSCCAHRTKLQLYILVKFWLRQSDVMHRIVMLLLRSSDVMCSASSRAARTSLPKETSRTKCTSRSACGTHRSHQQKRLP